MSAPIYSLPQLREAAAALMRARAFRFALRHARAAGLDVAVLRDGWEQSMCEARHWRALAHSIRWHEKPQRLNHRAIRALDAARRHSTSLRSAEEGERCDALFDGGEWSGPRWAQAVDELERDIAEQVAQRFGMPGDELIRQAMQAEYQHSANLQSRMRASRIEREAEDERQYWAHEEER